MRLVGLICMVFAAARPGAQEPLVTQSPVVLVTGTATVRRAPDVAFVTTAVETRSKTSREAQRQNADVMNVVLSRIAQSGVSKEALRTVGVRLEQEFDNANGRRTPRGFLARNALEIRIDDVSRVGEIADAAVQAGATSLDGIRFDLKDRAGAEREALRLAVADARARADAAAAGAGRAIDRILKIEEGNDTRGPRPMTMRMAEAVTVTGIETGLIDIRADVTLTASLK